MDPKSQQQKGKGRDDDLSKLNEAIEDLNRAKEASNVTQAKAVFGSTSALLPTIRVSSSQAAFKGRSLANVCRIQRLIERDTSN